MRDSLITNPRYLAILRELAQLAAATKPAQILTSASRLFDALNSGVFSDADLFSLRHWASRTLTRKLLYTRTLAGLAQLISRPERGAHLQATVQLAFDLLSSWGVGVSKQVVQRAQLGDLALAALAVAPAGAVATLATVGAAAATPSDLRAALKFATEQAGDFVSDFTAPSSFWPFLGLLALAYFWRR